MAIKNNILLPVHILSENKNVLVIGDVHLPYDHGDYLEFCLETYIKYNCNVVIQIGDLIDHNSISYHEKDGDLPSAKDEMFYTKHELKKWYKVFPDMALIDGNHTRLIARKIKSAGLSSDVMKSIETIYEMPPGWKLYNNIQLDNVLYIHGDGFSGIHPNYNAMLTKRCNVVLGHLHSVLSLQYHNNGNSTIWGMSVGAGVDNNSLAMAYAKYHRNKPCLGCGVVLNNGKEPHIIHMG